MDKNRKNLNLSTGFCIASTLFVLVLFGIMLLSHRKYSNTQEIIKYSNTTHIQSVESYYFFLIGCLITVFNLFSLHFLGSLKYIS